MKTCIWILNWSFLFLWQTELTPLWIRIVYFVLLFFFLWSCLQNTELRLAFFLLLIMFQSSCASPVSRCLPCPCVPLPYSLSYLDPWVLNFDPCYFKSSQVWFLMLFFCSCSRHSLHACSSMACFFLNKTHISVRTCICVCATCLEHLTERKASTLIGCVQTFAWSDRYCICAFLFLFPVPHMMLKWPLRVLMALLQW